MKTIKAGCFLIDKENKMIALIHREKQNDYSFPKGHVEQGEDIKSAAIRETAEETKRDAAPQTSGSSLDIPEFLNPKNRL